MGKEKSQREKIIRELKEFKDKSRTKFGVEKIILFGSAAAGNMTENSDVDLIVVSSKFLKKSFVKRPVGMRKLWKLDYPVDFLCYTPEEFEQGRKKVSIISEALKEGVEI